MRSPFGGADRGDVEVGGVDAGRRRLGEEGDPGRRAVLGRARGGAGRGSRPSGPAAGATPAAGSGRRRWSTTASGVEVVVVAGRGRRARSGCPRTAPSDAQQDHGRRSPMAMIRWRRRPTARRASAAARLPLPGGLPLSAVRGAGHGAEPGARPEAVGRAIREGLAAADSVPARGSRRPEVRWHVRGRPRAHARRGRPRGAHQSAGATRSSSSSRAMGKETDELLRLAREVSEHPARPRDGHARHRRRAQGHGAAVHGAARPRRRGRVVHRQPGRVHHRHHPHRTPRSSRCGPTASARPLDAGQVPVVGGAQGVSHRAATSRSSVGAAPTPPPWRSPTPSAPTVLRALHRRVGRVHQRSPGRPRRPQDGAHQLRRAARDDGQRLPEAGHALGRVRPQPRRRRCTCARRSPGSRAPVVTKEDDDMEQAIISAVMHDADEAKLTIAGVADRPGIAAKLLPGPRRRRHQRRHDRAEHLGGRGHRHLLHRAPRATLDRAVAICEARGRRDRRRRGHRRRRDRPGERGRAPA